MTDTITDVARRLLTAGRDRTPCAPIRSEAPQKDPLAWAYKVQSRNTETAIADGRRVSGRKIGLTSPAVQRQLGVDEPDFGGLFADMCITDGGEIPAKRLIQPKAEAEVALVLGADLTHEVTTVADLIRATDFALPALEIVDSRITDWDINIVDTIADNASSGMYVLGTRPVGLAQLDLPRLGMEMSVNDEVASAGSGAACLGNPLLAAIWLANTLAAAGNPLRAGDVVLTGALGPMITLAPGDRVSADFGELGTVFTRYATDTPQNSQEENA